MHEFENESLLIKLKEIELLIYCRVVVELLLAILLVRNVFNWNEDENHYQIEKMILRLMNQVYSCISPFGQEDGTTVFLNVAQR